MNENFKFTRPLTVTGVYLLSGASEPFFHQMVLDSIENEDDLNKATYVIHNTWLEHGGSAIKIPKTRAYYANQYVMQAYKDGDEYKYDCNGVFMWMVNDKIGNMQPETWYLLPQAFSIILTPDPTIDMDSSDSSDSSDSTSSSDSSEEEP